MRKSNVYLIELKSENETFYKIGVTVHKYCRFYQIMKFGYKAKILYMVFGLDMSDAYNIENLLHNIYSRHHYKPLQKFGGYLECYHQFDLNHYKEQINKLININYSYLENLEITWR